MEPEKLTHVLDSPNAAEFVYEDENSEPHE
jgi:hypothetical protein